MTWLCVPQSVSAQESEDSTSESSLPPEPLREPLMTWSQWATAVREEFGVRKSSALQCFGKERSLWPTPRTQDSGGNLYQRDRGNADLKRLTLAGEAKIWPFPTDAPTSEAFLTGLLRQEISADGFGQLKRELRSLGYPALERRRLSPQMTEWLMGWPPEWTGCGPSETELIRWWQRSPSLVSMLAFRGQVKPSPLAG